METNRLLQGIGQIEPRARAAMIDFPNGAVVFPRHAGTKTGFQMQEKLRDCATQKLTGPRRLRDSAQRLIEPGSECHQDTICGIPLASFFEIATIDSPNLVRIFLSPCVEGRALGERIFLPPGLALNPSGCFVALVPFPHVSLTRSFRHGVVRFD